MPGFTPTRRTVRLGGIVSRRRDWDAGAWEGVREARPRLVVFTAVVD